MLFVIPIGHESDKVRRLPWISFIIMAACLIIHILVSVEINKTAKELERDAKELINYYLKHPYLKLDPETKKLLFGEKNNEEVETMLDIYRRDASRSIRLFQEEKQEKLDQLSKKLKNAVNNLPYHRYGFIPAKKSYFGLLTYMFIHGGWLHLLGNLLLLYLTGPFIEDVWGRPIYTGFYLTVGMLSGLMFAQHYPNFTGPLIGASGAIAGLMGAFLVRYFNTRIRFLFIFAFIFRGTFKAPAWLMLPLWVVFEFFNANAVDSVSADGGGVAHWAHVWGFVFGVAAAVGMMALKIEEKHVHPKIEAQVHFVDEGYKAFEAAMLKKDEGKLDEAYALLLGAARRNPTNNDVVEGLWNVGAEIGKENEAAEFFIRSIENDIRHDQRDIALKSFHDLKDKIPQASLSLTYKFMLMKFLTGRKDFKQAKELADELVEEVDLNSSGELLQNFAKTAMEFSSSIASRVLELCLKHPGISEDEKKRLKTELGELEKKLQTADVVNDTEQVTAEPESQSEVEPAATEVEDQMVVEPIAKEVEDQSAVQPMADEVEGQMAVEPSSPEVQGQSKGEPKKPEDKSPLPVEPGRTEAGESEEKLQIAEAANNVEQITAELESQLEGKPEIAEVEGLPEAESKIPEAESQSEVEPDKSEASPVTKQSIIAIKAIPLSVKNGGIALNMEGFGQQLIPLKSVRSIAAAEIASPQQMPFLLIDLFLDDLDTNSDKIRTIRLFSTDFDAKKLFPSFQDDWEALKAFITILLKVSGATAYPNQDSVLLDPPMNFYSIKQYEKAILSKEYPSQFDEF